MYSFPCFTKDFISCFNEEMPVIREGCGGKGKPISTDRREGREVSSYLHLVKSND